MSLQFASARKIMRQEWLAVLLLFFTAALVFLGIYLYYNWPGKWISHAGPANWNGAALTMNKGQGYGSQGKLVIKGLSDQGTAVASLSPPVFQADDFSTITWFISGATPSVEFEFMWRTTENRVFIRPLVWTDNVLEPLKMTGDKNWHGQITDLALIVKGTLAAPILINSISLEPVSLTAILQDRMKQWLAFSPWQAASINFVDEDSIDKKFTPTLVILAIILLALILNAILILVKIMPWNTSMIWGMVLLGWLMLDFRWQSSLFQQLKLTYLQYAGKDWEEKHLAAEDGVLFDFMRQVKEKLPPGTTRILYFSDKEYLRGKGAYYLYPYNVLARNEFPQASQFRPGDYIVLFAKKRVRYDPAGQLLIWEEGQYVKADIQLLSNGNALLRVR